MKTDKTTLIHCIKKAKNIVAFTGAGLSAESGIPTYRGKGGLWTKYDPNKYANIDYFYENPKYYWNFFKDIRYPSIIKAQPNKAHCALVKLEQQKKLKTVITQNIDGLHQLAGQTRVIELHGNTRKFICTVCKNKYSITDVYQQLQSQLPPRCSCHGLIRPRTVMFGEPLPQQALMEATNAATTCDVFLVIGSSLVVYPAAQLPQIAKQNGANLIIINIDTTPLDHIADMVFHEKASTILTQIK